MSNEGGSVRHAGDKTSGSKGLLKGDQESREHIVVDLRRVSPNVKILAFAINSFSGTFEGVREYNTDIHLCKPNAGMEIRFSQEFCDKYCHQQERQREQKKDETDGKQTSEDSKEGVGEVEKDEKVSVSCKGSDVIRRAHNSVLVCKLYRSLVMTVAGAAESEADTIKKKRWVWMLQIKPVSGDGSSLGKLLSLIKKNLLSILPSLAREMPYRDVADICSVLSGQYLEKLSKTYPKGGLAVKPFIRLMMETIGLLNPPALAAMSNDPNVALHMVALLFDLFSQIDVDGNEFVEFDELLDFCVELGMISTGGGNTDVNPQKINSEGVEYVEDTSFGTSGIQFRGHEVARMVPVPRFGKFLVIERKKVDHGNVGVIRDKVKEKQGAVEQYRSSPKFNNVKERAINARCFDADGSFLHNIVLEPPPNTFAEHVCECTQVLDIAISEEMNVLATSGSDCIVQLWKMDTISMRSFTYLEAIHYPAAQTIVRFSQFHHAFSDPHLKKFFSIGEDRSLNTWDWETKTVKSTSAHQDVILDMLELGPTSMIATASFDATVQFWNVEKLSWQGTLQGHSNGVRKLSYLNVGNGVLMSVGFDDKAYTWDIPARRKELTLKGHKCSLVTGQLVQPCSIDSRVYGGIVSLDERSSILAITLDESSTFNIWDLSGTNGIEAILLHSFQMGGGGSVSDMNFTKGKHATTHNFNGLNSFLPYGNAVIAGGSRLKKFICNKKKVKNDGEKIMDQLPITHVEYNAASRLFVGLMGSNVFLWNAKTGTRERVFADMTPGDDITVMGFNFPSERKLYIGTQGGYLHIFNFVNGEPMGKTKIHEKAISALEYCHHTELIITVGFDSKLIVSKERESGDAFEILREVRRAHAGRAGLILFGFCVWVCVLCFGFVFWVWVLGFGFGFWVLVFWSFEFWVWGVG
jgi:WD40 repeat protein